MEREEKDEIYFYEVIQKSRIEYAATKDLEKLKIQFKEIDFYFNDPILVDTDGLSISFSKCSLWGERIDLIIREIDDFQNSIVFTDCEIYLAVFIKSSKLKYLIFSRSNIHDSNFNISDNQIDFLSIEGDADKKNEIKTLIFYNNKVTFWDCRLNNFKTILMNNSSFETGIQFNKNCLDDIESNNCNFNFEFIFLDNVTKYITFRKSNFGKLQAKGSNFGITGKFNDCNFLEISDFSGLISNNSTIKFENCNFKSSCSFNKSIVSSLEFRTVLFQNITSFQNLNCLNLIKFDATYFEKIGFFESIKIKYQNSLDLNTIRIIKGQLLKSESKIEYLKFNALEQKQHLKKINKYNPDYYILNLNSWSNDFGRNWFKGFKFTFKISVLFFLILISINSVIDSNYPLKLNLSSNFVDFSTILSEYLKFIFSFGFNNEEIQTNGFLFLIFIIAKIFIGYGIYQTISAFRKFGKI